jgi:hypothetical protein
MIPTGDLALPGSGTILRPFPFRFDFPLQEGFEFLTDVHTAADGSEQRVAVRDPARPRAIVKGHVVAFDRDEVMHLIALTFGWNLHTYGVPLWFHAMTLSADAHAGDATLAVVDLAGRDLADRLTAEDDIPILLWRAHDDWEPAILAAAAGGSLTLRDPVARDWPAAGTIVLPLAVMALADLIETQRPARGIAELDLEFVTASVPLSPNPEELCGNPDLTPDEGAAPTHAQMVRPNWGGAINYMVPGLYPYDHANSGALHPMYSDGAPAWQLFGYNVASPCGAGYHYVSNMHPSGKGRATAFQHCTNKCPVDFTRQILAIGLGTIVGTDCSLTACGVYPAGLQTPGAFVLGGVFSGLGYFEDPSGAPTVHNWLAVVATLMGGPSLARGVIGRGSIVSSYGLYDVGAPGGVQYYPLTPESTFTLDTVELKHGLCVRLSDLSEYEGVKIVTEKCHVVAGVEDGTFEAPIVTTHDFTSGELALDESFVVILTGGTTLLGNVHDGGGPMTGLPEAFRVTVSLVTPDEVEHLMWRDIFTAMLVQAAKV